MTHPLTDEMIEQITYETRCAPDPGDLVFNFDDMRTAADWQLGRDAEELNQMLYVLELAGKIDEAERMGLLNVFKKSMRPQEES